MKAETQHSKEKLLKAAFEVFSKLGFHGATTKVIAKTAQVNEALITRHFKSKEGLFLAVIEANLVNNADELDYPAQSTVEDEFLKFCDFIQRRSRSKSDFMRIVIGHSMQDKAFVCRADEQIIDKKKSFLKDRLEKLKSEGKIRQDVDVLLIEEVLSQQLFAATFFEDLIHKNCAESTRKLIDTAARILARGVSP